MLNSIKHAGTEEVRYRALSDMLNEHLISMESLSEKFKDAILTHLLSATLHANDDEKAILLNLSSEVAASRNSEDLLEAVHAKLASFFDIEGLTIILHSAENDSYQFHEYEKERTPAGDIQLKVNRRHEHNLQLRPVINEMADALTDLSFDTAEFVERYPEVDLFKSWEAKGWQNFAAVTLKVSGETLGHLILHMFPHAVASLRINLLRGISAQLSVALSNIKMVEETMRRRNEMELLLAINTDIASVRGTDELARFIKDKFKQLLGCSHTMIAVRNNDGLTYSAFLLDEDARAKTHLSNLSARDSNKINGPVLNQARQTSIPLLFDLDELALQEYQPLYVKINRQLQQKTLLVIRLAKGEEVFGFWLIYFKDRDIITTGKLQLIQSLSLQLCISVANILANQEIKSREEEKGRLLKFSSAIAPVRDHKLLAKILKVQFQELFGIEDYVIHLFDRESQKCMPFLYDASQAGAEPDELADNLNTLMTFPESILDLITEIDSPVLYEVNDTCLTLLPGPMTADAQSDNARIGMFIQIGSEGIAVLSFLHPDFRRVKQQEVLLKSICSQLSIAISNILANEKVNQQLIEIDRYKHQLEEETIYLKEEIEVNQNYAEIIGESQVMQKTFRMVTQVASSDSTVLILGETGTGKELIARAIHNNSPRKNKLMVKVNCAALPANLIESELFGHEKGSFTGATERRLGKFELANNGTLFLDEIGEMPLELQVKLLRALQEKEIERVGGRGTIKVDVRIIAATNRDLEKEVDEGRFRSDLYYRLNIFPIELSALRDRKEDIPILATHFIHRYAKKTGRQITTLGSKALQEMVHYSWPGNIRELEHLIERSILLSTGPMLKNIHLPTNKPKGTAATSAGEIALKTIDENECDHILKILKYCQGRISGPGGAADILGVPPSTLNSKIKRLGIKKEHLI
ncbi:sigma 54-interacting transcriptional regulator [Mucilaginibacter gossypii]|uniref:sigma 54-interacting transcriptional regulator n=1 Tax=Mucilaginibacter gossypii TaxID=551996 RepID=UPI001AA0F23E|nr:MULTISPECIES: sigma 54-interacting transcriptional regulator [Mucilaginibacter]QTE38562.1 sigma 54-interacting transcriptional regulator [Mucilaginibacter gossypii]